MTISVIDVITADDKVAMRQPEIILGQAMTEAIDALTAKWFSKMITEALLDSVKERLNYSNSLGSPIQ